MKATETAPPAGSPAGSPAEALIRSGGTGLTASGSAGRWIRVIRDPGRLASLRAGWSRLHRDHLGPGSELDWVATMAEARRHEYGLHVVALFEQGLVAGVAPLVETRGPVRRLQLSDDAGGFLYADRTSLRHLTDAVLRLRRPLLLDPLIAGSPTEAALATASRSGHVVRRATRLGGPSLPLDAGRADPTVRLRKSRAKDLRRRRRLAREHGPLHLEVWSPGRQLQALFEELKAIEFSGWKGREGTALQCDPTQEAALVAYLTGPHVADRVRVARLRFGDVTAAMDLGVISSNRYWSIKTAYRETFARCSPGHLMTAELLRWAATRDVERFEFGGETAPAKEMWGAGPVELSSMKIYPLAPAGVTALGVDAGAKAGRAMLRSWSGLR